jgi:hypothetical protein
MRPVWERGKTCTRFDLKRRGIEPLERPRRRWEDEFKMDLRKTGWRVVEWIHLAQDRDIGGLL